MTEQRIHAEREWLKEQINRGCAIGFPVIFNGTPATIIKLVPHDRVYLHTSTDRVGAVSITSLLPLKAPKRLGRKYYPDILKDFLTATQRYSEQRKSELENEINNCEQYLIRLDVDRERTEKKKEETEAKFKNFPSLKFDRAWLLEQLKLINKIPLVDRAYLSASGNIFVATHSLPMFDKDHTKLDGKLGRLYVKICLNNRILIRNRDFIYEDHPHPHCDSYGDSTCFGSHEPEIREMRRKGNLFLLVDFLLNFYSHIQQDDSPYVGYNDWLKGRSRIDNNYRSFVEGEYKL